MAISNRERRMILIGGVLVVGMLAWSALNPPGTPRTQRKLLPRAQAEQKRADALRTLARMRAEAEEIEPRIARMSFNLTPEEVVPRVIRELQRVARRSQVRLREVKPLRPRELPSGQGQRVPIEVRFRAPFLPHVIQFLYLIEDPEGRMVVEKLTITSAEARQQTVDVTVQVTVFTRSLSNNVEVKQGEKSDANATQS
ncbi:MAG: hypothetical protein RMJ43_13950 [Chloroherpetonaceae bacterium]|nr:type II secretion system protein M [Chthonomonadaceae bacterium]MDW8208933.1 hypothetical protein [Chloroherpetonaceae bacterium]